MWREPISASSSEAHRRELRPPASRGARATRSRSARVGAGAPATYKHAPGTGRPSRPGLGATLRGRERAPAPQADRPTARPPPRQVAPTAGARRALRRRGGTPVSSGGAAAGERRAAAPIGGGGLGGAAHRDERDRCLGGPAARPGGRVREPRGRTRRAGRPPARRAPAVPRGRVVRARANALSSSGPAAHRGSRRLAPAAARHATLPAPSSPSIAAGQRASGRPRCDSVAVVLPNWSRGGRSAPGGRFTRPQRAGRAARARDRS